METAPAFWLGNALIGAAIASVALFCDGYYYAALASVERDLTEKLRRLRTPTRNLRTYLNLWLAATGVVFLGFWLLLRNPVFALLAAGFLLAAPWYVVRRMAETRRRKIDDQLADSMVTLANAMKAGLSLPQAMEILASQCPRPICTEFQQIVGEYKMGKTLERTLLEAKERLASENFTLFFAAMMASHESGGRLNETVERIASSVVEMQRLERKVKAETAQARKSAVYMAIAPAVILTVYYFIDPINTKLLFTNGLGQVLLGVAILFNVVAYLWARQILNPDI